MNANETVTESDRGRETQRALNDNRWQREWERQQRTERDI